MECCICLEELDSTQKCMKLSVCDHVFHAHCLENWVSSVAAKAGRLRPRSIKCPLCLRESHLPHTKDGKKETEAEIEEACRVRDDLLNRSYAVRTEFTDDIYVAMVSSACEAVDRALEKRHDRMHDRFAD
jgi:hypothetical protein